MTGATVETSPQLYARMAGVSYLLGSVTSVAGQMVVRGMLVMSADGAGTAANILAHESLLRLGFASSFMAVPFHIAWAILFYELFKPVNRSLSLLAAFVMLMGCTMWVLSSLFPLSPSLVLQRRERLERICTRQLRALALVLLRMNAQAYDVGLVFFGFWCVLTGYVILRSTFPPRIIGVFETFYSGFESDGRLAEQLWDPEVAMESTGVFWIPVCQILESKGIEVRKGSTPAMLG